MVTTHFSSKIFWCSSLRRYVALELAQCCELRVSSFFLMSIGQPDQSDGGSKPTASNEAPFVNYDVNVVVRLVLCHQLGQSQSHQKVWTLGWNWHFNAQWKGFGLSLSFASASGGQWRRWDSRGRRVFWDLIVFEGPFILKNAVSHSLFLFTKRFIFLVYVQYNFCFFVFSHRSFVYIFSSVFREHHWWD